MVLSLLPASKSASSWHSAGKWLDHSLEKKGEQRAGVDGVDLHSQSPLSSETLLESQMVSIEAG